MRFISRTGSTPASGTNHIAEWSSLVARRAHNPKVMRFKSHLRNQKRKHTLVVCFSFLPAKRVCPFHDLRRREWESKAKTTECCFHRSDVSRCEQSEQGLPCEAMRHKSRRGKQIPSPQPYEHTIEIRTPKCSNITLLKTCSYFTPHFLFIINKILYQAMRFFWNQTILISTKIYVIIILQIDLTTLKF